MNTLRQLSARIARQCAVAVACAFNAVCAMQRCCPPPLRKFEIKFALRRIGILAGFAVCILTFAATDAQAQISCDEGERPVTNPFFNATGCFANADADIADTCIAAGWNLGFSFVQAGELLCYVRSELYDDKGFDSTKVNGRGFQTPSCDIVDENASVPCVKMFGDPLQFPTAIGDNDNRRFVANCDPDESKGLIPATINTIGATECTCAIAGQNIINNACVCPAGASVINNVCTCPANYELFGGVCLPDSPRDFGELSDAVLCGAFGGEVFEDTLPQEADELRRQINLLAESTSAAERTVYDDMAYVIQAKFDGRDTSSVNTFLARYDTGGDDYNADVYSRIIVRANTSYGAGTFSDTKSNELARILARVPVKDPNNKCGANNGDAFCILNDEADSAGVLPCEEQFPRLWACHNAGWSVSVNNGGSCGVLLTLASQTTLTLALSDQCYLSGSASPQCDDVFGADVDFPAPAFSTDGATLRFVYNCDPDGESGLIPATANTIAATECGCESGASVFSDVCISDDGDLGLSDELLCGAFGGTVQTATGGREVCSGMDANDTFCIMDSAAGFPCRGLFKHLRSCNVQFNRKALNPFFCGEKCGAQKAVGSGCR